MQIGTKTSFKSLDALDPRIAPEARGERLKRVRNLANLSRRDLCDGSDLNINTYKGWEIGRYGGLTRSGAERVLARLKKEGVVCSLDWLYYGMGSGPQVRPDHLSIQQALQDASVEHFVPSKDKKAEEQQIIKELIVFRQSNKHSIELVVSDAGMLPFYRPGDYVAGVRRYGDKIANLMNQDCIVQTEEGYTMLRRLKASTQQDAQPGTYTLVCSNLEVDGVQPVLYGVKIVSAAPVIWHRKREED